MAVSSLWANELPPRYFDYVYALRNPLYDYDIFYVGRTYYPKERLLAHISESRIDKSSPTNKRKAQIIREIILSGSKPLMAIIDKTEIRSDYDKYVAEYKECYWISFYLQIGWDLANIKDTNIANNSTSIEYLQRRIGYGGGLSSHTFYYGTDKNGDEIYDIQKILKLGYRIPDGMYPKEKPTEIVYDYSEYSDLQYDL